MIGLIPLQKDKEFKLKSLSVDCRILNLLTCCTAEFVYHNGRNKNSEALFSFPLEGGCVVYYLEAIIGKKRIIGVCKETTEAKNMYEAAKEMGQKAAIIERKRGMNDVFNCSIGNIPKKSDARIIIKFALELRLSVTEIEESNVDRFNLCLPLILRPRYTPTEYKSDVEVYQVTQKYEYRFKATFTGTKFIKDISSVNHKLEMNYTNDYKTHAELVLLSEYDGCTDLDINIDYVNMKQPSVIYELGTESEQYPNNKEMGSFYKCGVAMVNFLPTFEKSHKEAHYEIIIIVDRSGSMAGANIEKAKECLLIFLKSLPINCKFQIYGFGSNFNKAFNTSQLYDDRSINIALTYQKNLDASFGGTELMQPLRDMYNTPLGDDYSRIAFLLTDGDVGNQDEVINLVRKNNDKTRLFTVGIGDGVSTSLVDEVAKAGCGKSAFVRNSLQLSASVMNLLDIALNCDHFTNSKIQWKCPDNVSIITVPSTIRPIFSNHFLTVFCMINGLKGDDKIECTLTGNVNGRSVSFSMDIDVNNAIVDEEFRVHRLLGKYKIDEMSIEIDDGKEDIKKALIELSTQVNIVTKWTTFVAIDPEVSEKKNSMSEPKSIDYFSVLKKNESINTNKRNSVIKNKVKDRASISKLKFWRKSSTADSFERAAYFEECSFYKDMNTPYSEYDCDSFEMDARLKYCLFERAMPRDVNKEKMKADSDCDGGLSLSSKTKEEINKPNDIVMFLVDKQNICGSWNYSDEILERIGLDLSNFKQSKPESISDDIWITAVVHQYFVIKEQAREQEWRLFCKKAKLWIENTLKDPKTLNMVMEQSLKLFSN